MLLLRPPGRGTKVWIHRGVPAPSSNLWHVSRFSFYQTGCRLATGLRGGLGPDLPQPRTCLPCQSFRRRLVARRNRRKTPTLPID